MRPSQTQGEAPAVTRAALSVDDEHCLTVLGMTHSAGSREAKIEYTAMLLGATGNVGGHILDLLVQSPLCKKVVVVTRRNVAELSNPKAQQVVVNMDNLEA